MDFLKVNLIKKKSNFNLKDFNGILWNLLLESVT